MTHDALLVQVSGTVASHTEDLASFVSTLDHPPVLIGHSFGGGSRELRQGHAVFWNLLCF